MNLIGEVLSGCPRESLLASIFSMIFANPRQRQPISSADKTPNQSSGSSVDAVRPIVWHSPGQQEAHAIRQTGSDSSQQYFLGRRCCQPSTPIPQTTAHANCQRLSSTSSFKAHSWRDDGRGKNRAGAQRPTESTAASPARKDDYNLNPYRLIANQPERGSNWETIRSSGGHCDGPLSSRVGRLAKAVSYGEEKKRKTARTEDEENRVVWAGPVLA